MPISWRDLSVEKHHKIVEVLHRDELIIRVILSDHSGARIEFLRREGRTWTEFGFWIYSADYEKLRQAFPLWDDFIKGIAQEDSADGSQDRV